MGAVMYRERIYDIFAEPTEKTESQIHQALDIGTEYLDLSIGFFTRITDGRQEILYATGDHPLIQPGESCPLEEAYCRRTIKIESPLAIEDANVSSAISDTAVETFDLGAYIGAKVIVNGETWGTACFADNDPRDEAFTEAERFFVELIARLGGQAIERRTYKQQLTEREEQLDEQREIYQAVINASFDSVLRFDTAGTFTYASQSVRELLGYSSEELEGQPVTLTHPDIQTTEWAWEKFSQILDGEPAEARDFPLETKSGTIVYTDIRGVPIYDGSILESERSADDIVGIQVLVRDASDRRQREGLISVINRVLRHNVRNEMTVIRGWADILAEELDASGAEKAAVISGAATRLLDLTESAQQIEQYRELTPELGPLNLIPVVERIVAECETRYPDVSVTVTSPERAIAETLPRVEIALFELIDNAAKHGGEPATVGVNVGVTDRHITLRVSDCGSGLPNVERAVLESGRETPLVHGQGLGLWLSYWIITTLDGEIEVVEYQQGTTIEIRLPKPPADRCTTGG
ncbi:ATP-binding protein [Halobellus captivus]|uniref:ATP-binding protein n=1 Tax=Halobellus captivus TaxID=2592614 RepID=UPI0011A61B3E|nr:ATP-binding protein [Halobellus captivus]